MAQQGKKKKGGAAKVILAVLLVVILTAGGMALFAYREINGNGLKSGTEVTVSIPQGSGVAAIANRLKDESSALPTCSAGMWGRRAQQGSSNMVILRCKQGDILTMDSSRPSLPTRRPTASG